MNEERIELLPCPFCGGDPVEKEGDTDGGRHVYWIECSVCKCGIMVHAKADEARKSWNRREK